MADISKITLPSGQSYDIKDAQARSDIADIQRAITGGIHFIGETTTALTDGATTNPITINSQSVTAVSGDLVIYDNKEFLYDGSKWIEMGDLSVLGALAYKNSASTTYTPAGTVSQPSFTGSSTTVSISAEASESGNYTPAGSVSAPTISLSSGGSTTTVNSITAVGTLPSFTATVASETLTMGWSAGTLPTKGSDTTVKTGDGSYTASAPSFTGTKAAITGSCTPNGSVSQPSFNGTQATITVT